MNFGATLNRNVAPNAVESIRSVTSTGPVRVLFAGAGAFGRQHLDRLAGRSDVRLVGVADANPAALELVKSRYGVENCLKVFLPG